MYFKFQRRFNLLDVKDDYAHLRSINSSGDLLFDFFYNINIRDAIANDALNVRVTIFSKTVQLKQLLENTTKGAINSVKLVTNITTRIPDAKNAIKQQADLNIAAKNSDISSRINNEIIDQLRAKIPTNNIQQLRKSKLKLVQAADVKESAEIQPILTQIAHKYTSDIVTVHSSSLDEDPTKLMFDMLTRQGIDPSCVLQLTHRSVPSVDAKGGILRPTRAQEFEHSPSTRLLNNYIFQPQSMARPLTTDEIQDDSYVQVLINEADAKVEVPISILIPGYAIKSKEKFDSNNLYVRFELINTKNGLAVDTIQKQLDIIKHIQLFYSPRKPPLVKATKSDISSRVNLEIKQLDEGASSVEVYKKVLYRTTLDASEYSLIGTYDITKEQQSLLVQTEKLQDAVAIYRVIPIGKQSTQSFEFTNVVVKPSTYRPTKSLSLTVAAIDIGVRIEARQIPKNVVAVEFMVRNLTIHESTYTNVGGDITLVDPSIRENDYITIVDDNVFSGNVYEYVARLVYKSGTREYTGSAIIEFMKPSPWKVDTKISELVVEKAQSASEDTMNVTFNIQTTVVDSNQDVVHKLLKAAGMYDLFKDDVQKEREFLKSLIAHNVQRVNLTTGLREDFGVVTTEKFSDYDLRKNQAILPLRLSDKYRYEVTALLRSAETMFDALVKDKIDPVTKKTYSFSPAKFLHPITLDRGVIVSSVGMKLRYSKEQLSYGAVGSTESVDVSFDNEKASIIDATAARFDKYFNVISWKVQGNTKSIDHFVIMKDVLGVRTLIGKAHSEFQYGNCQYFHKVSRRDEGAFCYVIIPIFNDYKVGYPSKTNVVIVEPFTTYAGKQI